MDQQQKPPVIDSESPVLGVFSSAEFSQLTNKEKEYSYWFSSATYEGSKICFFQKSYESPALLSLFQLTFNGQSLEDLKKNALNLKVTEQEFKQFLVYSAAVYNNCGNFKSFGDTKFIPECSQEAFENILRSSQNYKGFQHLIDSTYAEIKHLIFNFQGGFKKIGFPPNEGTSGYYSSNITKEEIQSIDETLQILNIDPLNTRIVKFKEENHYGVLVGSIRIETKTHFHNNKKISIINGDFSPILRRVVKRLEKAQKFAANKNQENMIQKYIEHFNDGSMDIHKDSQRAWIKDKGPSVETNLGFIETYLDPKQVRAEFEGFVSIVNKEQSKKTQHFVDNAHLFLKQLPWPKEFEKDVFNKPDFTNLSVLSFGSSGIPLGINIPNYDDIRQQEGFKNVYLGNALPGIKTVQFMDESDVDVLKKWFGQAMFHKVVFHELLGHGCGKLFQKTQDGLNFDQNLLNPITQQPITKYYQEKQTWNSVFENLSNPYEECRADSVSLYFASLKQSYEVLQNEVSENWKEICFAVYLEFINAGINGLQFYDADHQKWGQAHIQGRWVILNVLLEAGNNFLSVEAKQLENGQKTISVKFDREQAFTTGHKAMGDFLLKLQVYKSTADIESAKVMFGNYSKVNQKFLEIRQIVLDNKKPRRLELQGHLERDNEEVKYIVFNENIEGVIEMYKKRYSGFDSEVHELWLEHKEIMKPNF